MYSGRCCTDDLGHRRWASTFRPATPTRGDRRADGALAASLRADPPPEAKPSLATASQIDTDQPIDRDENAEEHEVSRNDKRDHEQRETAPCEIFEHFARNPAGNPAYNCHRSTLFRCRLIACTGD
jgi:hypothetical protein